MSQSTSRYVQLDGVYVKVWRGSNCKTKGLILDVQGQETLIALSKPLRLLMVSEIKPGDLLRVLVEEKKQKAVAINIMKVAHDMYPPVMDQSSDARDDIPDQSRRQVPAQSPVDHGVEQPQQTARSLKKSSKFPTVQICKKGTCRKRGSLDLLQQWQAERDRDSSLAGVECQLTGCLKYCKAGVNVRVGDRIISHAQSKSLANVIGADRSS